jgi:hypothetical protein
MWRLATGLDTATLASSFQTILFQISLVLIFIVAVIIYRTLVAIPLFQDETLRPVAQVTIEVPLPLPV